MIRPTSRSEHLFIVRMWREEGPDTASRWRGSVEHLPSSQKRYFANTADLMEFITLRLEDKSSGRLSATATDGTTITP